jgi:hypothetical protein
VERLLNIYAIKRCCPARGRSTARVDVIFCVCSASRRPVCRAQRRPHLSSVCVILPGGLRLRPTDASGLGSRLRRVLWRVWGGRRIQAGASSPCGRPRRLSNSSWISAGLELMATGGDTFPGSRHSRPCSFLLPRSEAYRAPKAWWPSGCRGQERRPAAAVTEAGAALRPCTVRPVLFHGYAHRLYLGNRRNP